LGSDDRNRFAAALLHAALHVELDSPGDPRERHMPPKF
jgi:hypothetical protein